MAQVHDLILVTRNTADVSGLGVRKLNPFDEAKAQLSPPKASATRPCNPTHLRIASCCLP
jgi:hypothetical protein